MSPRLLTLAGTVLEVAGTFLLAVEAIKLPNLRLLRERLLKSTALKINPTITLVDEDTAETRAVDRLLNISGLVLIGLGASIFYAILHFSGHTLGDAWRAYSSMIPGADWRDYVIAVPAVLILLILSGAIGSCFYWLIVTVLDAAMFLLAAIEKHASSGIVGILGFLLFLIGAVIKATIEWSRG